MSFGKFKRNNPRVGAPYPFGPHKDKYLLQIEIENSLKNKIRNYKLRIRNLYLSPDDVLWLTFVLKSTVEKFLFTIEHQYYEEEDDETIESEAEKFFHKNLDRRVKRHMILHRDFRVDKEKLKNVKELCTIPFSDIFNTALDWIDDDLDFSNKIFSVYVQRFIDITCQNNTFQAPFFSEHPKKLFL